jgi:hypothetical protein
MSIQILLDELAEMLSRYNLLRNNLEKLFVGCSHTQVFGWNWEGVHHMVFILLNWCKKYKWEEE